MFKELFDKFEISLKTCFWALMDLVLVALLFVGVYSVVAMKHYKESLYPSRTISVSAEGKTVVTPDIASFSFSVVSEGKDAVKISADNVKKMNSAIDYIKSQGIDAKDVKTAGYSLAPRYEYDENTRKTFISGYTITQTVFVKVRDFSKIGGVLSYLPSLGINQISSLSFEVENQDAYLNVARQEAFDKAYAKAKSMAKQNKVKIEKVLTFYESNYPIYRTKYAADSLMEMGGAASSIAPATIEPGSQEVTVNVTVTYEIE